MVSRKPSVKYIKYFIAISIVITVILTILPKNVFAEGNVSGTGDNSSYKQAEGGPSYTRTGFLVYVIDKRTGKLASPDAVFMSNGRGDYLTARGNYPGDSFGGVNVTCRYAKTTTPTRKSNSVPWGLDFCGDSGNESHAAEIKQWLESPQGTYASGGAGLINTLWGTNTDFINKVTSNEKENYYLIIENVAWGKMKFMGNSMSGACSASGASNLATYMENLAPGMPQFKSWMFTKAMQVCEHFEANWPGLEKVDPAGADSFTVVPTDVSATFKTPYQMRNFGYGIAAFRIAGGGGVDTYNHISSPGDPEHEPEGKCNIVKDYIKVTRTEGV